MKMIESDALNRKINHQSMFGRFIWPDVFIKPDFSYDESDNRQKRKALADGLSGWGICMSGGNIDEPLPEGFGDGMVKIGNILDEMATADNLMKVVAEYKARTRTL